jgi:hypothetical protein
MRAFVKRRRGRPAAPSTGRARRDPVSHRAGPDHGTDQLAAKKRALVRGGDPALSEYPLGVCLARGLVSRDLHDDGLHYAGLYSRVARGYGVGRMHGSVEGLWQALASGFPDRAHGDGTGGPGRRLVERFLAARLALAEAGRPALETVHQVVAFQQFPAFLLAPEARDAAQGLAALLAGLEALHTHFSIRHPRRPR